jgi:hypothetical protein
MTGTTDMSEATATPPAVPPASNEDAGFYPMRYLRKDVGVAIVAGVFLLIGFLIMTWANTRTATFSAQDVPFSITYPAGWQTAESLLDAPLMKVEDPLAASAFKTSMTVDTRELDPAAPPTLQEQLDRRVQDRSTLTGYHFLANNETTVDGQKAMRYEYAYTAQPIDQPRRASLPVVVVAQEYIVLGKDRTYYITFAVPENEVDLNQPRIERAIQSVKLQ